MRQDLFELVLVETMNGEFMEPVRIGVIGCGVIGSRHLSIAKDSDHIELVAAADLIDSNRERAAERFNLSNIYDNDIDLLDNDEIEAVVLAFPTQYRTEVALRAFAKGKHVLIEKPIAMNVDEVNQLIEARGDLVSACCSSRNRFNKAARLATELITTGGIGDLRTVHCRAIRGCGKEPGSPRPAWRLKKSLNGGGILVNWGCYDIDFLLGITGWKLKPRTVLAQTWTVPPKFESHIAPGSDAETHYNALVTCEDGTVITLERGEFMTTHSHSDWEIIGSDGSLKMNMGDGNPSKITHNQITTADGVISNPLEDTGDTEGPHYGDPTTDFAAAIRQNRQPLTSLERAFVVQQITDGIYASAESGTAVDISD